MKPISILVIVLMLQGFAHAQPKETEKPPLSDSLKGEQIEEKIESRFIGHVKWVKMDDKSEKEVVPIGIRPRWLVAVEIISIEKPFKPFDKKGQVVLLVPSPTRLLGIYSNNKPEELFQFIISGVLRDDKPEYKFVSAGTYLEPQENASSLKQERHSLTDVLEQTEDSLKVFDLKVMNRNFLDMVTLVHTEYPAKIRSAAALRLKATDPTNSLFMEVFNDSNPDVRLGAINAIAVKTLVKEKTKACPMELVQALFDENQRVRELASCYVYDYDEFPKESLPLLIKVLRDSDPTIQQAIAGNFYRLGDIAKEGVPDLIKLLDHKDPWIRHNASISLWYITRQPKLFLRTTVELNSMVTPEGAKDQLTPGVATAYFFMTLEEEVPEELGSELIALLTDSSSQIRASAARLLIPMASRDKMNKKILQELKVEEALEKLTKDPEWKVRQQAKISLEKLKKMEEQEGLKR
jgi:hypothetical protein